MKSVIEKLEADIEILKKRVEAKEAILKSVFSSIEERPEERQLIHKVLSVKPKILSPAPNVSLEQSWCVGFEDTVCVSITANNTGQHSVMPICHLLEPSVGIVKYVAIDEHGLNLPCIRAESSADLLVGFSKSTYFTRASAVLLLEFQPLSTNRYHSFSDKETRVRFAFDKVIALPPDESVSRKVETHTLSISSPRNWYTFANFATAKEHEMLLLLRCLKIASHCCAIEPTSSYDFTEANPDFKCCDFGEWQVFVGCRMMDGVVAISSTFDQPNAKIDRVYGRNAELLEHFARKQSTVRTV